MKIEFKPFHQNAAITEKFPTPAIKSLPSWYSKIPTFVGKDKKFKRYPDGSLNATIKFCNPFLDSLTAGYFLYLKADLQVYKEDGQLKIVWSYGGDLVSTHSKEQISAEQIPAGFSDQPYKFMNEWVVKTPKGYSLLFTHPLNRPELPFHTLSGFVDTDDYQNPVNLPFFIREDFEGIISAGTPIAQIIPIKREKWTHSISKFDPHEVEKQKAILFGTVYRAYKTLFWKRKDYK